MKILKIILFIFTFFILGSFIANASTVTGGTTVTVDYTLSINTTGTGVGTVNGAGTYTSGTVVNMIANPSTGSVFSGWSGDADCTDGSVTMDATKSCTATFTAINYNVIFNGNGSTGGSMANNLYFSLRFLQRRASEMTINHKP